MEPVSGAPENRENGREEEGSRGVQGLCAGSATMATRRARSGPLRLPDELMLSPILVPSFCSCVSIK